jgi:hypothetical protein
MSEIVRAAGTRDNLIRRSPRTGEFIRIKPRAIHCYEILSGHIHVTALEADFVRVSGIRLLLTTSVAVVVHHQNGASSVASRIPLSMEARFTATL